MASPNIKVAEIERDMLRRGWNRRDLARAAGLGESTITRFLNGGYRTPKSLKRIAMALDRPVDRYIEKGAVA
jgi:transcriptional regulator with XRE-family HTH domain